MTLYIGIFRATFAETLLCCSRNILPVNPEDLCIIERNAILLPKLFQPTVLRFLPSADALNCRKRF